MDSKAAVEISFKSDNNDLSHAMENTADRVFYVLYEWTLEVFRNSFRMFTGVLLLLMSCIKLETDS